MSAAHGPAVLIRHARDLAQILLARTQERWRHTIGVGRRAEDVARIRDAAEDREILVAAAWVHDIGYSEQLYDTGFHPLDGARYLQRHGWLPRLAGLVAHHSEASSVAGVRGLTGELDRFPREDSLVADALTYADQMVRPDGRSMTFEQRQADMLNRHGPSSLNATANPAASAAVAGGDRAGRATPERCPAGVSRLTHHAPTQLSSGPARRFAEPGRRRCTAPGARRARLA
jgi:hypothetical protein